MLLLRQLVQLAMQHGFDFRCEHVPGVLNVGADILSRHGDCAQFRAACPSMDPHPVALPVIDLPSL